MLEYQIDTFGGKYEYPGLTRTGAAISYPRRLRYFLSE